MSDRQTVGKGSKRQDRFPIENGWRRFHGAVCLWHASIMSVSFEIPDFYSPAASNIGLYSSVTPGYGVYYPAILLWIQ